jgi:diguanylate cyclase (GGDEF)-like protein/PAS domain S-box-containing protein
LLRLDFTAARADHLMVDTPGISPLTQSPGQPRGPGELLRQTERRLMAGFMSSPIGLARIGCDGTVLLANPAWLSIVGWTIDDLQLRRQHLPVHPDERASSMEVFASLTSGAIRTWVGERRYLQTDGSLTFTLSTAAMVPGGDGQIDFIMSQLVDITASKHAEQQLAASEQQLRTVFDSAPIGMGSVHRDGHFTSANDALCDLLGTGLQELIGSCAHARFTDDARRTAYAAFTAALAGEAPVKPFEATFVRGESDVRRGTFHLAHLRRSDGSTEALVQLVDITERYVLEQQLQYQADHDSMTGLWNRRAFSRALDHHCARVARIGPTGALLLIDLDNFKQVNDRLGHHTGDDVLVAVSDALQQRVRATDMLARLGGDEFAVLMVDANPAEAAALANVLVDVVRFAASELVRDDAAQVTASIGVSTFAASTSADDVQAAADLAMYAAKSAGRNGWCDLGQAPTLYQR